MTDLQREAKLNCRVEDHGARHEIQKASRVIDHAILEGCEGGADVHICGLQYNPRPTEI
jgi:hypothetical protein